MSEADLQREALGVKGLVTEAREALRAEMESRHLSVKSINWKADLPRPNQRKPKHIGDRAGEHTEMLRGKYTAWPYVWLSFALEVVAILLSVMGTLEKAFGVEHSLALLTGATVGVALALAIYWDRWAVIEAYSSESCSGVINLSIFYVPILALLYANYRGFLKLKSR